MTRTRSHSHHNANQPPHSAQRLGRVPAEICGRSTFPLTPDMQVLTGCTLMSWLRIRQKAFFQRHAKSLPPLRHLQQHQTCTQAGSFTHSFLYLT